MDMTLHVHKDLLNEDYRWQVVVFDKMLSPDEIPALNLKLSNDYGFMGFMDYIFCRRNGNVICIKF